MDQPIVKNEVTEPLATADRDFAALAKALAHPVRVAILRQLLQDGDCVNGTLVGRLPLAQSTVSEHLRILKNAGFVRGTIDGPRVCYCADLEVLRRFVRQAGMLEALASCCTPQRGGSCASPETKEKSHE